MQRYRAEHAIVRRFIVPRRFVASWSYGFLYVLDDRDIVDDCIHGAPSWSAELNPHYDSTERGAL